MLMKKRIRRLVCTLMVMMFMMAVAIPALASPKIREAEYEGSGRVDVEFKTDVKYKNVKVKVTDTKGKAYSTVIRSKDEDDLTFEIKSYKKGVTYKYTITGVKQKNEKNYGQVSGKVTIPATTSAPKAKKVEYDRHDNEVDFDFTTAVQWKAPKVTISDGKKNYVVKILEKDNDGIEVRVKTLKKGARYTYKITGVRVKGNQTYKTVTGTFIAK